MAEYIMELRKVVGSRPIIAAGSVVIICDEEGRVLLQRRSENGYWGLPGGAMELEESFEDTARREVFEETGLTAGKLTLLGLHSGENTFYEYPNGHQVYNATAVFVTSDFTGNIQADGSEGLELNFFDLCDLPKNISPPDMPILAQFIQDVEGNS
ncbi:NUDIX hydrolase [Sulfoacidibacillus ferrooxidans]|uniref:RNA pyrophosphohydrolase n=1 Tax=Sulfoacidibacillus ferrooxidans TaxID=2005001 RepID=A0A9X2AFT4_9BACL|nr:NUDIX hydrolase [Sulfoacidibacillus ferrooxidans]MCI0184376.1 RNA pyrophosphohydrolase [Sulfoacidibacillus ferrooxidans]